MDLYELILDEENGFIGTYAMSAVSDPAMNEGFVLLSKEGDFSFSEVDKERQIILGAALVPNRRILRFDKEKGEEYEVFFTADTIRKTAESFMKNGFQANATLEHIKPLEGATIVESWIVENPTKDKSNIYGKTYPKGTWVVGMKIDDKEQWEKRMKSGDVLGFSIEGKYGLKKTDEPVSELQTMLSEVEAMLAKM
jgi:hypothetical protein